MTQWVGLSGGIGSGKSLVAQLFATQHQVPLINADAIAHNLTADNSVALPLIGEKLGKDYLSADNSLNRTLLREAVFNDDGIRKQLEAILHPLIWQEIEQQKAATSPQTPYGIIEIPLLTEQPSFQALVSHILIVDCSESLQIKRVQARSQLKRAMIERIMANQASRSQRLAIADDVIENNGSLESLTLAVAKQHQRYCQLFVG